MNNNKIKIGLLHAPPLIYQDIMNNNTGYEYTILKEFIKEHNINAELIYLKRKKGEIKTYNDYIDDVVKGKYDIIIGNITQNVERNEKINFSRFLFFDITSVFYEKPSSLSGNFYINIFYSIIQFLIIALLFGLLIAYIHNITSPSKLSFTDSFSRVMATLLGGTRSNLVEKKLSGSWVYIFTRIIIIFIAALFTLQLSAIITSERLADITKTLPFSKYDDLQNKHLLVFKNTSDSDTLKSLQNKYNLKITELDENYDPETISKYYEKFKKEYSIDGFFMSSEVFTYYNNSLYNKGSILFRKSVGGAAFNKKHTKLLEQFNETLFKLRKKNYIFENCQKYFKDPRNVCLQ